MLAIPNFFDLYTLVFIFVFGAIIGSFLNVVIYRFHTGRSINGSSHCMSCMRDLRWFELFPLFSYIALRGKCRTCRSIVPPRYFVVEILTALAFTMVYLKSDSIIESFLLGALVSILIVIAIYDINHYIIPNELVIIVCIFVISLVAFELYGGGNWDSLIFASLSGLGAFLFYGGLWKISHGRWIGLGDAKLGLPLGFLVGLPGIFSVIVLSFWIGAGVSIVIITIQKLLQRGKIPLRIFGSPLTIKSEIPFAPFLILGFVLNYFYGADVLSLVSYVL